MFSVKCVSVLVALVSLSVPSTSRSWGGNDRFPQKSWIAEPNEGPHPRSNHGWGHSSEEESWESKEDYQQYQGYGYDNYDHFGFHHDREGHHFDHFHHGDDECHHYPGHKNYNSDGKNYYHGHHDRSEPTLPPSSGLPQNHKGNSHNLRPTPAQNTGIKPKLPVPPKSQNRDQFSKNYADRVVFPEESPAPKPSTTRSPLVPSWSSSPQSPPSRQPAVPQATQSPPASTTISSLVLADIVRCIRDCPATPEFNPVCGTNNVTYNNLGDLECTRNCGVNVAVKRRAPCPQPLPPAYFISVPTLSTERPIVNARAGDDTSNEPKPRSGIGAPVNPTKFTNILSALEESDFNIDRRTVKMET